MEQGKLSKHVLMIINYYYFFFWGGVVGEREGKCVDQHNKIHKPNLKDN